MNRERLATWIVWALAIVLPGGLALLALWLSVRAAKRRQLVVHNVTSASERLSQVPGVLHS